MEHKYAQYGCGRSCPDGWANFDTSPSIWLEQLPIIGRMIKVNTERFPSNIKIGNIVKGLPINDASLRGVYASHVLEHLSYDAFWIALKNTFQMLEPGGIFRLVVPDLESRARYYCNELDRAVPTANSNFLRQTHLGLESRSDSLVGKLRAIAGNSAHLWMWDYVSMEDALLSVGFSEVRRATFNDSTDPMFKLVEDKSRFVWSPISNPSLSWNECAVEARKAL